MTNDENKYCVYKHTSPSSKVYIGITNKYPPEKRWYPDGSGYKRQQFFWRAIQKYGWDNFEHKILFENLTKEEACEKEIELIKMYDSTNPDKGYNCSTGGENSLAGIQWTDDMKNNRSKIYSGKGNPFYGKKHSEKTKEKMSKSKQGHEPYNKGKSPSYETLQLWSKQRKGKYFGNAKPMDKESKERLSVSHNFQKKTVIQLDLNKNMVAEYESISHASRVTGIGISSISKCCNKQCQSAGGYLWEFKDDNYNSTTKSKAIPVIQFDKNGNFITEYNSISEANRETGIAMTGISACCKHKRLTAGGFVWRYKEDEQYRKN
jgi:group I intron endonuclease